MKVCRIVRFLILSVAIICSNNVRANDVDGLVLFPSTHSVVETIDKQAAVLESKGMKIFTRVDHSAGAAGAGMELRPTQLLIFGNPKVGTPLMICSQSIALDLPQKMLAWEAEDGKVYLGYNDPAYLKRRHNTEGCDEVLSRVSGALENFAKAATSK